jgi:hypothetical protein
MWEVAPLVWRLRVAEFTLSAIARELNRHRIAAGNVKRWDGGTIKRVLRRTRDAFPRQVDAILASGRCLWPASRDERNKKVIPLMAELRGRGKSYAAIADELNRGSIKTPVSGRWYGATVKRLLAQAGRLQNTAGLAA